MVEQFMDSVCPLTKLFHFFLTKNSHGSNYYKILNLKYKCYTYFLTVPCTLPKEAFRVGVAFRLYDVQSVTSLCYSVII